MIPRQTKSQKAASVVTLSDLDAVGPTASASMIAAAGVIHRAVLAHETDDGESSAAYVSQADTNTTQGDGDLHKEEEDRNGGLFTGQGTADAIP